MDRLGPGHGGQPGTTDVRDAPFTSRSGRTDATAVMHWKLVDIEAGNGYAAALAVGGGNDTCDVRCYTVNVDKDLL